MDVCEHTTMWRARDGWWRCLICQPPVFESEVKQIVEGQEALRLFDDPAATWDRAAVTAA